MKIIAIIKQKISSSLKDGVNELSKIISPNSVHYDEFIILSARIKKVEIAFRQGQISWETADLENTKLIKSTLDLLNDLEEPDLILTSEIDFQEYSEDAEENDINNAKENELGYLDYSEQSQEHGEIIKHSMENMATYISEIGEKIGNSTSKLEKLAEENLDTKEKNKAVKLITNNLAKEIEEFDRKLIFELSEFRENSTFWIEKQYKAIKISYLSGVDSEAELKYLVDQLEPFKNSISFARDSINNFYQVMNSLPNVTLKFNIAKNKSSKTLLKLVKELDMLYEKVESYSDNLSKTMAEKSD